MVDKKDSIWDGRKSSTRSFRCWTSQKRSRKVSSTIEFVRCDSATLRIPALEWTRERKLAVLIVNVQRSRAVNGCDQERKTHWSRGGVNITPGFWPCIHLHVSICHAQCAMVVDSWSRSHRAQRLKENSLACCHPHNVFGHVVIVTSFLCVPHRFTPCLTMLHGSRDSLGVASRLLRCVEPLVDVM